MAKTIGILGGMTPESTVLYYDRIIHAYQDRFGDYAFPPVVVYSVSFQQYVDWMFAGDWDAIASGLCGGMRALERAGAEIGIIATNTMHREFDRVAASVSIPLISIIDATAERILKRGIGTVGLLGTVFTMREPFYRERLADFGIDTVVPSEEDQQEVSRIIFDELGRGEILEASRNNYLEIIRRMEADGARGVILGCSEIPLLVRQEHCHIPVFDTSVLHADKALEAALAEA